MQHVVVTGRGAPAELIEAADTVTEMRAVKHAFEAGVRAQKGRTLTAQGVRGRGSPRGCPIRRHPSLFLSEDLKVLKEPRWERLRLWYTLRETFLGEPMPEDLSRWF